MGFNFNINFRGVKDITNLTADTVGNVGNFFNLLLGQGLYPYEGPVSFTDPKGAEKPFAPHYNEHIRPLVGQYENRRIEALKEFRNLSRVCLPIGIMTSALSLYFIVAFDNVDVKKAAGAFGMIALFLIFYLCSRPVSKYKSDIKGDIFPKVFSFFGDYCYNKEGIPSVSIFKPSDIIPSYDNERTEDYIKGEYKGVTLEITEARLEVESRDSEGRRSTHNVFKGVLVLLSMHKSFKGKTIIKRDRGGMINWLTDKFNALEKVGLEDPVFEKKFEVYSDDQVEARYLLTTSFMERLLKLSELMQSNYIQASFYDNKLLMMMDSDKNRFETSSIYMPATFEEDIDTILAEMNEIFQIIDILKLDQNIGM